ncbi:MAG TPA: hypothetical protein H9830_01245 [Candidatus Agrococcus pullicola]|uniref:Secreted protein n=1 Tax=Candidatus Agrococcus pullicola TaxID=2838429 RepID=A0A9D1YSP1_9MICO|nr:hypothetical protein [Candidatus Agrococcus pullicola]
MTRRRAASTLLVALISTALTGCILLPTTADDPSNPPTSHDPGAPITETGGDPEHDNKPDPVFNEEDYVAEDVPTEWPESIPKPDGQPVGGQGSPSFYLVEGDTEYYDEYTETLLALPDAELIDRDDREGRNPSVSIRIGEYRLIVMHHPDNDWLSVGIRYDIW